MVNLNASVLNDPELPRMLGKQGTASDIALYNRKTEDAIYTFASPIGYPEKLAPLLQAIALGDCAILSAGSLTPQLGEVVLALDALGVKRGFLVLKNIAEEQVRKVLKNTVAENYPLIEGSYSAIIEALRGVSPEENPELTVPIDHFFEVRGAGMVVLGAVKGGVLRVHDELLLLPANKSVAVKSIQMQDESVQEAGQGSRVGMAIKGAGVEELKRGFVLAAKDNRLRVSQELEAELRINPFFKEPLKPGSRCMVSLGLQYESAVVEELNAKEIKAGEKCLARLRCKKPLVHAKGERIALARPDAKPLRIVGGGALL